MKKTLTVVALAAMLAGCGQRPPEPDQIPLKTVADGRVRVERIASFRDELAYGGIRGVFLITDKESGSKFIGISGIGISELGSHQSGKNTYRDER